MQMIFSKRFKLTNKNKEKMNENSIQEYKELKPWLLVINDSKH